MDITDEASVRAGLARVLAEFGRADILINNAANDPRSRPTRTRAGAAWSASAWDLWNKDIAVGLTGGLPVRRVIGEHLAKNGGGVILNIASDLGVIAPDQRIYRKEGLPEDSQPVKPVTYSVVKHGLVGLTRYLATYWADQGVRVNAVSPGGVYTNQPEEFLAKAHEPDPPRAHGPSGRVQGRGPVPGFRRLVVHDRGQRFGRRVAGPAGDPMKLSAEQKRLVAEYNAAVGSGLAVPQDWPCLCGSTDAAPVYTHDRHGLWGPVGVCRKCGLVYATPRLEERVYEGFYGSDAYRLVYEPEADVLAAAENKFRQGVNRHIFEALEPHLRKAQGRTVLEFGCGGGVEPRPFPAGRGYQVKGYDYSPELTAFGREKGLDSGSRILRGHFRKI